MMVQVNFFAYWGTLKFMNKAKKTHYSRLFLPGAKLYFFGLLGFSRFCVPIPDGFSYTPQEPPYPTLTFPASTMIGTWRLPPDSLSISWSRALSFFTS
jgi:hypothetical protein